MTSVSLGVYSFKGLRHDYNDFRVDVALPAIAALDGGVKRVTTSTSLSSQTGCFWRHHAPPAPVAEPVHGKGMWTLSHLSPFGVLGTADGNRIPSCLPVWG